MYRVKIFSTVLLILCTLSLYGCAEAPANRSASNAPATMTSAMPEVNFEPDEKRNIAESDVACLKPGMTLGSIIDLIGSPHADELSVDYPLLYSWKIDEEKKLYIKFETEDYDEFTSMYQNDAFVLPDEEQTYDSHGIPIATPNEVKVFGEWIRGYRAVYSYIVSNGEEEVLFDLEAK